MSMSLDGFIEDRDGGVRQSVAWYQQGDKAVTTPGDGPLCPNVRFVVDGEGCELDQVRGGAHQRRIFTGA
jgi:hypothetical protein